MDYDDKRNKVNILTVKIALLASGGLTRQWELKRDSTLGLPVAISEESGTPF